MKSNKTYVIFGFGGGHDAEPLVLCFSNDEAKMIIEAALSSNLLPAHQFGFRVVEFIDGVASTNINYMLDGGRIYSWNYDPISDPIWREHFHTIARNIIKEK